MTRARWLRAAAAALGAAALAEAGWAALLDGDAAWTRRAEGTVEGRPRVATISAAIEAYEAALATEPASLEARWKLLRALYFAGYFAERESARANERFARALAVSDAGVALLASHGPPPHERPAAALAALAPATRRREVARFYFWSAINWGAWAQANGLLAAVREGVANRLRDYALVTVALEPELEAGGAHRLLARLHATLPALPLVSGWVDRRRAIPEAERALALAPDDPGNRLLLALTILDVGADRRAEALDVLTEIALLEPRADSLVEDLSMQRSAAERLAAERGRGAEGSGR